MLAFDVALLVLVNVPVKAPLLLNVEEFVTSPVIVPFDVNSPSFEMLPVIPAFEVKVPEFDILSLTVIPPAFVKLESSDILIVPCANSLSAVIAPATFNIPLPENLPKLLVPLTVKLPLLLIVPRLFKVTFTVVSFVFVNVFSVFTVNPF